MRCGLALIWSAALALGADAIQVGVLGADRPTLHHLGVRLPYSGDDNQNAVASVRYRAAGDSLWRVGLPLHRVRPETVVGFAAVREFAGTVFDLQPGANYEVEVSVADPDGGPVLPQVLSLRTRAIPPAEPVTPRTVAVSNVAALEAAASQALPGDVILVAPGVYPVEYLGLLNSGTVANPIVLRGASRDGVILDGGNCSCNVVETFGSYTTVENLTIRNAQQGLRFVTPGTVGQVVRRVTMTNVYRGINGQPGQLDTLIADNVLTGRAEPLSNAYGMQIFGEGGVVMHNRLSGFDDGVRIFERGARAMDVLNNEVQNMLDDGIELDTSAGNIRVLRNRVTNVDSAISTQPVYGGPAYLVRNTAEGVQNEQVKFHSLGAANPNHPSGVLAYHNTFVSAERALSMFSANPGYNSVFRNNRFIGPAQLTEGIAAYWTGPRFQVTFDNNGYYPDGAFRFREGVGELRYASLAAMRAGGLLEGQSTLLTLPLTGAASNGVDRAAALPNLNDRFAGAAPDLGSLESGCIAPVTGPRAAIEPRERLTFGSCPAQAVDVLPRVSSGAVQTLTFRFSDPEGAEELGVVNVLINSALDARNACYLAYDVPSAVLYLVDDAGSGLTGITLGGIGSVTNSQCTILSTGSSAVRSGNVLTLNLAVSFLQAGFAGRKVVYLAARDQGGNNSGWQPLGVQDLGGLTAGAPAVVSVTPGTGTGTGATATLTIRYRDTVNAANLQAAQLLIARAVDGRNACYLGYDAVANALYLLSDSGTELLTPAIVPGGSGSAQLANQQCRVEANGTSRVVSGTDLELTVKLTFLGSFSGPKILYGGVQAAGGNSGWQAMGAWTAP